jgi:hypothetical protein
MVVSKGICKVDGLWGAVRMELPIVTLRGYFKQALFICRHNSGTLVPYGLRYNVALCTDCKLKVGILRCVLCPDLSSQPGVTTAITHLRHLACNLDSTGILTDHRMR